MLEVEPTGHTGRTANGSSKMGRGISFHRHRGDTSLYVDLFGLHTLTAGECRARKMAISLLRETSKKCACYTTIMHRPIQLRGNEMTMTLEWAIPSQVSITCLFTCVVRHSFLEKSFRIISCNLS